MMYPLNFETCTARDVITRSVTCHPTLFREGMIQAAKIHANYAAISRDKTAAGIADRASIECLSVYDAIDNEDVDCIVAECATMVQAFTIAARLQCIPRTTASEIMQREDDKAAQS